MQYRKFGKLDWKGSALGFGCMRLPRIDNDYAVIDEPAATRLLHYAIDHGVNYLDTGYHYHQRQSEPFIGRALRGGYRNKVKLATKLPPWEIEGIEDCDRLLNEQLTKLQTDFIDFYLLHGMNQERWPKVRDLGVLEWAEKAQMMDVSIIWAFLSMTSTRSFRKLLMPTTNGHSARFNTTIWISQLKPA